MDGGVAGPTVAEFSDDDGYVSPEFDLPPEEEGGGSESESEVERPSKRVRKNARPTTSTLEEEEELALQMLRTKR